MFSIFFFFCLLIIELSWIVLFIIVYNNKLFHSASFQLSKLKNSSLLFHLLLLSICVRFDLFIYLLYCIFANLLLISRWLIGFSIVALQGRAHRYSDTLTSDTFDSSNWPQITVFCIYIGDKLICKCSMSRLS